MSTLTVTNIKATGETASRAVSGVAAAWVNFDASTNSINDSLNASSLTDSATGNFLVNVSSSFANTSYSVTSGQGNLITSFRTGYDSVVPSTVSAYIFSKYKTSTGLFEDPEKAQAHCMGDLA